MYTNVSEITFFEKTVQNRSSVYVPHRIFDVYCTMTKANTESSHNVQIKSISDELFISIPNTSLSSYIPKCGDMVSLSYSEEPNNETSYTVMNVENCLYGSNAVKHIEVTAV